jgi:hypothetical protein
MLTAIVAVAALFVLFGLVRPRGGCTHNCGMCAHTCGSTETDHE